MAARLRTLLLAALVASGFMISAPTTAFAADCSGSHIRHLPIYRGGTPSGQVMAYIDVYYSSANGGTNCVRVNKISPYYGVAHDMRLYLMRCTGSSGSTCQYLIKPAGGYDRLVHDVGIFSQYAGPVSVTGTANVCINYELRMYTTGGSYLGGYTIGRAQHCG